MLKREGQMVEGKVKMKRKKSSCGKLEVVEKGYRAVEAAVGRIVVR